VLGVEMVGDAMKGQTFIRPQGLLVFRSLEDAARNGFQFYDKTTGYFLVRASMANGWALALAEQK
jgi:hypothetical protein